MNGQNQLQVQDEETEDGVLDHTSAFIAEIKSFYIAKRAFGREKYQLIDLQNQSNFKIPFY